jgi:transcriptional regulator with XRE-family HTH domain
VVQWGWRQNLAAGREQEVMKQGITIQERLKDLRTELPLKSEELAVATKISKSALGSYENDELKEISHKNLVELAKFYGVSTDYLLCLTENRNHPDTEIYVDGVATAAIGLSVSLRTSSYILEIPSPVSISRLFSFPFNR